MAPLAGWFCGLALLGRRNTCRADAAPVAAQADVSIIIPARNEEQNLPRLLASIRQQECRPREVIVVDDGSTDATAEMARRSGATVIQSADLPDGWRGKPWACWQGAQAATAPHLLFLDADTWFEPRGLGRILRCYFETPGVLSLIPYHVVPTLTEQLSAFFNLVMAAGIGAFTPFGRESDALCGQMLLLDRDTYFRTGGHERVRAHVLENFHLARHLRDAGVPLRCMAGRGTLSIRMYPGGLSELVPGWTKGFASGAGATSAFLLILTIFWLSGAAAAAVDLLRFHSPTALMVYLLFAAQLGLLLRRFGSFWPITAILFPLPLAFFFMIFANSVLRSGRQVTWKGRVIRAA